MISLSQTDLSIVQLLGQSIKRMRLNKNMTQEALANKAGLDRATISRIENGATSTVISFVQILRALEQLFILDGFLKVNEISPIAELKKQQKEKQRATPRKNLTRKKQ